MGFRSEEPDVEFEGVIESTTAKAVLFQADEWDKAEWLPRSQCTIVPDHDSDTQGKATVFIKAWLVEKNGWKK